MSLRASDRRHLAWQSASPGGGANSGRALEKNVFAQQIRCNQSVLQENGLPHQSADWFAMTLFKFGAKNSPKNSNFLCSGILFHRERSCIFYPALHPTPDSQKPPQSSSFGVVRSDEEVGRAPPSFPQIKAPALIWKGVMGERIRSRRTFAKRLFGCGVQ